MSIQPGDRYALFTWLAYEAEGGFGDLAASSNNLQELVDDTEVLYPGQCYQIIDLTTFEEVSPP